MTPFAPILSLLSKVPWWLWLGGAFLTWGLWNGYRAKSARADFNEAKIEAKVEREASVKAAAIETARRTKAHMEITDAEVLRRTAAEATAARLLAADQRLRVQSAALAASASRDSQAAGGGQAAAEAARVLSELFGECRSRVRTLVREADSTRAAGSNCEQAYDELRKAP